jgi:hypothetical protein
MNFLRATLAAAVFLLSLFSIAASAEAAKPLFKAPRGTIVEDQSSGKDYALWSIYYPDYSAYAVVGRSKLPAQYVSSKAFRKFIKSAVEGEQSYAQYGIKAKVTWRKNSYILSGTGPEYRIYVKGRLGKGGYWYYASMYGKKGSAKTRALEKMIKAVE